MPNNPIPFPSLESFAICNDKSQFEYFMLQNGFSDYLPLSKDEIKFPFILKKSQDEGGVNTFIINNNKDLDTFKEQLNDPNYIKQSVIEGKNEYATHILIEDGKIKNALTIVYKFDDTVYIKGKDKYICRNICKSKHLEIFENILQTMDFNGLCCVNYKEKDGVPMILEINPRFGGSLCEYFYPFLQKVI
jgi:carbamoylphosphate synthase large subunit